jgi:hypothetical protein
MSEKIVFFSRCRPLGADPIDLAVRVRRIFIGWPAWREGVQPRRGQLRKAIIDLRCSDQEWAKHYAGFKNKDRKQFQQNRNFVHAIKRGAIALIPRPNRGVVYAGRVKTPFELLDNPPWGNEYLDLRREQGQDIAAEFSHLGDVAQCCEVERFTTIPFPLVPAWIRRSLLGRSTYGRISPFRELGLDPYPILERLMEKPERLALRWTTDLNEVERRLVDGVGPNVFEHLCVALLQLENPKDVWMHVGGSGDGGVDGVGASIDGRVVGLLQCKWSYEGEEIEIAAPTSQGNVRQIIAALLHPGNVETRGRMEFWSRRYIASLMVKHARTLPLAVTLRIRAGS